MLCKPKPSARRKKWQRIVCVVTAVVLILSVYLEFAVKTQLTNVIVAEMKTLAQRAVNTAVTEYLAENPDVGQSLISVSRTDGGAVAAITSDPAAINRFKAQICDLSQRRIDSLARSEGLRVPLGSFSGSVFLTNLGPDIRIDIGSRQTVACSLQSAFESAGMNQTLHHVILTVEVDIVVFNPYKISRMIHVSSDFEIAQTVIVGAVPNYTYGALCQ